MSRFNIESYHVWQGLTFIPVGVLTTYFGYKSYTIYKSTTIDSKVQACFDEKMRKRFANDVSDAYYMSTLDKREATISVQKRWEMDGQWQKALEERC